MLVEKIKPLIALLLIGLFWGSELAILGAYLQPEPSGASCGNQKESDSASSNMCPMGYGTCTPQDPCGCCVGKYPAAKTKTEHGGSRASLIICSADCGHLPLFSLPQFSRMAILTPEVRLTYQIIFTPLSGLNSPEIPLVYLIPPKKPPRMFLAA